MGNSVVDDDLPRKKRVDVARKNADKIEDQNHATRKLEPVCLKPPLAEYIVLNV